MGFAKEVDNMVDSTELDKFRRKPLAEGLRKYFTN